MQDFHISYDVYKKELQNAKKIQTEENLYPIVKFVVESAIGDDLDAVITANNKQYNKERKDVTKSQSAYPDLLIVKKQFEYNKSQKGDLNDIIGAIEVKSLEDKLEYKAEDITEVVGHLLSYKNVLFTNGKLWIMYKANSYENKLKEIFDKKNDEEKLLEYDLNKKAISELFYLNQCKMWHIRIENEQDYEYLLDKLTEMNIHK